LFFRKIVLTTLLAAALPLTSIAQKRTTRRAPARTAAGAAQRPKANSPGAAAQSGVNISAADMALVVEGIGFPEEVRAQLASSPEERKSFAKDIREMLAVAEQAKAAGYLARPELKLQTELARAFVIAQAYFKRQQGAGASGPEQVVTPAEIDAFFNEPATPAQFEAFLQDYSKNGPLKGAPVPEAQRKELRAHYGRVMLALRKGVAAGLDRERKTQLMVMLQQARLLASAYSKELEPRFKVADAEIDAYIAAHPELDTKAARAKAEGLLARARAGEDFTKLANEFTEDPSGKGTGGDLGWFGHGAMVKPFEDAAFALKPGELSGIVETQFGYHIIKVEERRAPGAGGADEQLHARHILIGFGTAKRGRTSPREQARAAVEEEKRQRVLDEIVARGRVQVADDYTVAAVTGPGSSPTDVDSAVGTVPRDSTRQTPAAQTPAGGKAPASKAPARRRP
jgi:parvulin-like peptidyl-prolyl isomerase